MKQVKIIVRDDNFIRIQTPLSFAYDFAQRGVPSTFCSLVSPSAS